MVGRQRGDAAGDHGRASFRVVDTTGFVSADHHVHLINSPDSTVSKDERIVTMLAEGVDYFVASDHDFKTDLTADVAALGASSLIKTGISNEITYFDSGHFGAYPLDLVPGSVTDGAIDWGRIRRRRRVSAIRRTAATT